MIQLESVSRDYVTQAGTVHALRDVDLTIDRGEFIAIMGQSGSGKSTLMNIVGCLDRPTSGRYLLEGNDTGGLDQDARARLRGCAFGYVFQAYNLLPRMSALEQVELPLVYQRTPNRRRLAAEALDRVGLLDRMHHSPQQLSGGEQQRVAIARSLVVDPILVLADEPTGALDTQTGHEVMELFKELVAERNITVIVVTHENEVAAYADRTLRMRDGRVISDSSAPDAQPVPLRTSQS